MKLSLPKFLLHVEGLVALLTAGILYRHLGASWGWFALLFLAPDLSMAGYLLGKKAGAGIYDAAHTYLGPFLVWTITLASGHAMLLPICLIWVAHIGFDRLLGYGLKYETGFKDTHLHRV
jgi:hypothetical protein